jgi:ribosomal protein L37E
MREVNGGWIMCEKCGKRIEYYNNRKYCDICWDSVRKELWKEASKRYRDKTSS